MNQRLDLVLFMERFVPLEEQLNIYAGEEVEAQRRAVSNRIELSVQAIYRGGITQKSHTSSHDAAIKKGVLQDRERGRISSSRPLSHSC
jgi:hypothetical protein